MWLGDNSRSNYRWGCHLDSWWQLKGRGKGGYVMLSIGRDWFTYNKERIITGNMNHLVITSWHELDSHVFPSGGGGAVPRPWDTTRRACVVNTCWGWFRRIHVCAHKGRCGKSEKGKESAGDKHFFLAGKKRDGRVQLVKRLTLLFGRWVKKTGYIYVQKECVCGKGSEIYVGCVRW